MFLRGCLQKVVQKQQNVNSDLKEDFLRAERLGIAMMSKTGSSKSLVSFL